MNDTPDPNKKLSNIFGLPVDNTLRPNGKLIVPDNQDDYEYGRQNIIDLIEQGNQYLQQFGQVALSAQEPRHFEVLTNLLNSLIEANEKLLSLKKANIDIKAKELNDGDKNITNNNMLVCSTTDLQLLLSNMKNKNGEN